MESKNQPNDQEHCEHHDGIDDGEYDEGQYEGEYIDQGYVDESGQLIGEEEYQEMMMAHHHVKAQ